ncbi:MAG: tRNA 2-thiouridine(34) synthase MnmA [Candidatus Zambryskibacteria bacterium]|nr:tRNA 2-thiouridine(34) synthase MnmA [Candidatus Zambryskibacteria bacterium]
MKSVLYARVSTEEQKSNQTIDTQIHGIGGMMQYAINHKLPVPDESMMFIDDGFSGATLIRPALTAFREYLKTHDDVAYFLVYDADRIGRDTYNQLIILEELKKKNVTIHFKTGELGTTPNDKLLFTILSAFSEFERAKIMERTQRGMKRRIESGKFNGGRPLFGYRYNYPLGKHELDETEAKVVKMIYDWYTEDKLNIRQIQAKLFELKIPTKYDALKNTEKNRKMKGLKKYPVGWWSEVTIRNVLANEAYTGRWYCCKNQTIKLDVANLRTGKPKVRQIRRAKEEWFPIEIPRIVSDEQHKKGLLQARKNLMFAKRCTKQTYLLQGLIRCGKDHLKYRGHQEKSGVIYYYCKSRMNNTPQKNCNSPYLRADQIEPIVWNTVKSILENPEEVFNNFRNESILNEERAKSIDGRLDYISSAIKKLEVAKKRITEAFKAEVMTLPELRKEKTDIELSEEKLISERDGLIMKLNVQHDVSAKIDLFKETCHKFLSKINDPKIVTERLKKDIIKLVIDEVVIEGESVKIFATIPLPNKIHEREMDKTDIPGTFNAGATLGPVNETNMARIWNKHKQSNTPLKRKVFVGLSGGVDSAVSAALLKEQGFDVTGVFIKAWQPEWMHCTWREERRDAMRVALALDIPFLFLDFEKEYKEQVVDKMLSEYKANRTPNPDVLCNREIKFGAFWQEAKKLGADCIATGHYAQITYNQQQTTDNKTLKEGRDKEKDQSYFLWTLTPEDLEHTIFPVGDISKNEVRKLAEEYKLPVAEKKDSQGICFLGDVSMEEFLSHYVSSKPGRVLNVDGETIGRHKGLVYYTIGERRGFEITKKSRESGPFYIVAKDITTNTLVVSDKEEEILDFSPQKIILKNVNWINEPEYPELTGRIRYRGDKLPLTLSTQGKKLVVEFKEPVRGLSLGQSLVFYQGDVCLGGGIMDKVLE